jgi:hypothetical protein
VSSVSNGLYFLTLPLVSVTRVIYTSKGMSKKFGVRVIYRKIRYLRGYLQRGVSQKEMRSNFLIKGKNSQSGHVIDIILKFIYSNMKEYSLKTSGFYLI